MSVICRCMQLCTGDFFGENSKNNQKQQSAPSGSYALDRLLQQSAPSKNFTLFQTHTQSGKCTKSETHMCFVS